MLSIKKYFVALRNTILVMRYFSDIDKAELIDAELALDRAVFEILATAKVVNGKKPKSQKLRFYVAQKMQENATLETKSFSALIDSVKRDILSTMLKGDSLPGFLYD